MWDVDFMVQYEEIGEAVVNKLDGMFSFVLYDTRDQSFIAARDPIGITPLYLGWGLDGLLSSPSLWTFFCFTLGRRACEYVA
jgi:asparagine synthetase B (glutamine-hydrolysing)